MCDEDQSSKDRARYSIGELAKLGGVSRRTVRYYVQRGLLAAPTGLGRGRHYTQRHLDDLIRVRRLQEAGHPLAEIGARLAAPSEPAGHPRDPLADAIGEAIEVPAPSSYSSWTRIEITDGIELHLRDTRLDSHQVLTVAEAIKKIIRENYHE